MSAPESTQVMPLPVWDDPRVHLLDDVWLLTIFAILIAVGVPWFVSALEVQLVGAAVGVLVLAAVHVAFTALAAPAQPNPWRRRALGLLHATGVIVVAAVWQFAGGLQNPMFLFVFALPIIGATFLSRWHPYLMGIVCIIAVGAAALTQSAELRWYAGGLGPTGAWLAALASRGSFGSDTPFPGFYAPTGYFMVLLEVFAILVLACAVAAEHLGTIFDRLYAHIAVARAEAQRGQELWIGLIEHLPGPAVLVDASTLQVVCASEALGAVLAQEPAAVVGRNLFEAIPFSYPEILQELISGPGGSARNVAIHREGYTALTEVRAQPIAHRGRRFAVLLLQDMTEPFAVRAALDAAEYATLVIDAGARVLAFNRPAGALFEGTQTGADATRLMPQPGAPDQWWLPGIAGRRKMHVRIGPRLYQVTSTAVGLPGEEDPLYVVTFLPVGRMEAQNAPLLATERRSAGGG